MTTVIDTSTASTASAYSNQRKVDRCQNGVLWTSHIRLDVPRLYYSTDDGATWSSLQSIQYDNGTPTNVEAYNYSIFIDVDDYLHVVWKDAGSTGLTSENIYYVRGTPNAARTSWTWSNSISLNSSLGQFFNYPDVVAFRTPGSSPTTWQVCVVTTFFAAGADGLAIYERLTVANNGTVTQGQTDGLSALGGMGQLSANYSPTGKPTWTSIDFNHTGDGKTVAGGTPHLYAAWSAGAAGAGKGIRFKKATYSGGSWTWGTEREIDSTRYVGDVTTGFWINCLFDGTRAIIGGLMFGGDLMLYERDAADTTTTTRTLINNAATSDYRFFGALTYDGDGNVYLFGVENASASPFDFGYRQWERASDTLGANTLVTADTGNGWVSAKRGYSDGLIEFIYTDGTASPYDVTYGSISLNAPPNAPTLVSPVSEQVGAPGITYDWDFNDPDMPNDTQTAYALVRKRVK